MLHLDTAAAGRSSPATREAASRHAELEAEVGAYVAEERAQPVLAAGRAALAGLLGVRPEGVALVESASAALVTALRAWPLRPGDRVAVVPSEWGPNLAAFSDAGLEVAGLPTSGDGLVDLDGLDRVLATDPPALVHLTQVASHRPLVQPVAEAAARCQRAGVPLWVDAAQALGHVDTRCGAALVYSTSRKWLAGPRGVGVLGVAEHWWHRLRVPSAASVVDPEAPPVRLLESHEAHVAGRVGLATAVREHVEAGPANRHARLADVGRRTREALADLPGWEVVRPAGPSVAITALRARGAVDVVTARTRLLHEHAVLATAGLPFRAPREMREPLLRISPYAGCTDADLAVLHRALAAVAA